MSNQPTHLQGIFLQGSRELKISVRRAFIYPATGTSDFYVVRQAFYNEHLLKQLKTRRPLNNVLFVSSVVYAVMPMDLCEFCAMTLPMIVQRKFLG